MFRHSQGHDGYPGQGFAGHPGGSLYNTFAPGMMDPHDPHGGHESDESGEYDRLGFDPVSNHHRK